MWPHGVLQLLAGRAGCQPEGRELPDVRQARAKGPARRCAVRLRGLLTRGSVSLRSFMVYRGVL